MEFTEMPQDKQKMLMNEIDRFEDQSADQVKIIQEFLKTDDIGNKEIRDKFWAIFTKHIMLANFRVKGGEDEEIAMRNFLIVIDKYLNSLPSYKIDVELNRDISNMKLLFQFMLSRSRDGFERKLDSTQIKQLISTDDRERPKKGILSKLLPFGR